MDRFCNMHYFFQVSLLHENVNRCLKRAYLKNVMVTQIRLLILISKMEIRIKTLIKYLKFCKILNLWKKQYNNFFLLLIRKLFSV